MPENTSMKTHHTHTPTLADTLTVCTDTPWTLTDTGGGFTAWITEWNGTTLAVTNEAEDDEIHPYAEHTLGIYPSTNWQDGNPDGTTYLTFPTLGDLCEHLDNLTPEGCPICFAVADECECWICPECDATNHHTAPICRSCHN